MPSPMTNRVVLAVLFLAFLVYGLLVVRQPILYALLGLVAVAAVAVAQRLVNSRTGSQ